MATRVLKWFDLAAQKCGVQATVIAVNSSSDLVNQRVFQAFKRHRPYLKVLELNSSSFNGVLSPVYIYDKDLVNCLTLEEFKTCNFEKNNEISESAEICASKIKKAATSGFKITYFILMSIILIFTLVLSFFW